MPKKPLSPDDFPVSSDHEKLVTDRGKPIAEAETESLAEDIAERLNDDEARREEDRWSA